MARLFFALWPDAAARAALAAPGRGGRPADGRPARGRRRSCISRSCSSARSIPGGSRRSPAPRRRVAAEAFDLSLDRLGAFARAGVAWAGCERPPAGARRRCRRSWSGTSGMRGSRRTIARSPRTSRWRGTRAHPLAPESIDPVAWRVASFALVESVRGEGAPTGRWPNGRSRREKHEGRAGRREAFWGKPTRLRGATRAASPAACAADPSGRASYSGSGLEGPEARGFRSAHRLDQRGDDRGDRGSHGLRGGRGLLRRLLFRWLLLGFLGRLLRSLLLLGRGLLLRYLLLRSLFLGGASSSRRASSSQRASSSPQASW